MKKIFLTIVSVIVSVSMNAQVIKVYDTMTSTTEPVATYTNSNTATYKVVFEEAPAAPATTGTAKATLTAGSSTETDVQWVQLWENGPKFAAINVGQTVTDYSTITTATYSLANVGGLYTWGGTVDSNDGTYSDDHNTGTAVLTGDNDTATKLWGSNWRMPTKDELENLDTKCTWTWCSGASGSQYVEGCTLAGWKVSGLSTDETYKNNSVFFPVAGYNQASAKKEQGSSGGFWSSTPKDADTEYRYTFMVIFGSLGVDNQYGSWGYSVRAVLK